MKLTTLRVFGALIAIVLALLAACGRTGTDARLTPADPGALPGGLSLAALPPLPGLSPARHTAASDVQEVNGDTLFSHTANVTLDTNNHTANFAPASGQLAFGVQEFSVGSADRIAGVACELNGVDGGENVLVAISDYANGVWKILPVQSNGSFNIDLGGATGFSNGSKLYLAVLGWKSQFQLLLSRVTLAVGFYPGWAHSWGDIGVDPGSRMAIDTNGNILYAGGYAAYPVTATDFSRIALLQLSPAGALLQSKTYQIFDDVSTTESLHFSDMLRKDDGTVYLIGRNSGTAAGEDGIIIKLDSALNIVWAKGYDTGADDDINCAAFKANGDLVCAGESLFADDNFHQDAWMITVNGSTGEVLNSSLYEIADTSEVVRYIDLDETNGKVLLAGDVSGDTLSGDAFVASVSLAGALNWARQYGGADSDYATGVSRGANGNAFAAVSFENVNDSVLITIDNGGALLSEHGFIDAAGTVGLSVWRMVYNQASGGPLMAGARLDDQGMGVGGVTSLIQFDGDLAPLSGTTYGWYFVDWRFTPQSLYTTSFTGLGAALLPTTSSVTDGSLSSKAGAGTFASLSASVSSPVVSTATADVTATDTPGRFDGEITDESDLDFQMIRFDPPTP